MEIWSAAIISVFLLYSRYTVNKMADRYDEKTITPSDYTLYFFIEKS